jgi:hypothetical protein
MGLTKPRASQIFDIDYKQATRVITISDVTLAGGAPSQVDGVNLAEDDRVLVTGQDTASQNGLYFVSSVGTGANGTWLRTSDGNENGEVQAGMIVMVTEGSLYHDTQWKLTTNNPIVIGTTALTFVINILSQIGGANTQIQYNNAGTMGGSANLTWDGTTLYTNGAVSATGNVTGSQFNGSGVGLTLIPGANVTGTVANATYATSAGTVGSANTAVTVTGNAQANITSVGVLTSLSVTGTATAGNLVTSGTASATGNITGGNVLTSGAGGDISGTGNIYAGGEISATGDITSAGNVAALNFNSTSADLAENYLADADYPPGTVVVFGGNKEITVSNTSHDTAVAGIISTAPSYLMNAGQAGEWVLPVALTGRVPCLVQGPVGKGTVLVTSTVSGTAVALDASKFEPGCVVGKSLEIINSTDVVTIEVAVGRL